MTTTDAVMALNRFGLGGRRGDAARIASDPRGALKEELAAPGAFDLGNPELKDSPTIFMGLAEDYKKRKALRSVLAAQIEGTGGRAAGAGMMDKDVGDDKAGMALADKGEAPRGATPKIKVPPLFSTTVYLDEIQARLDKARAVPVGFGERLVAFWANHFAVQSGPSAVRALAGAFEREAIRPHVLGRFRDMLSAVAHHPAMLISLDNSRSVGPDSPVGRRRDRGINENYGRELMELHTLGVGGGYTQADVIEVAKALTGWTYAKYNTADPAVRGRFVFRRRLHEPGVRTVMGKRYPDRGEAQGQAILDDLARKPATARHVMRQFAQAFVADNPPPALVDALVRRFAETDGDLGAVTRTLIDHDAAWTDGRNKLRTPREFLFAAERALDDRMPAHFALRAMRTLGQAPWNPPSPAGYPNDAASWLGPNALQSRLEVAQLLASRDHGDTDPRAILADILGPVASTETAATIARADTRAQGLTLLLMSPEFQWS